MTNRSHHAATLRADRTPGAWARADLARIDASMARAEANSLTAILARDKRAKELMDAYRARRQPRGILAKAAALIRIVIA